MKPGHILILLLILVGLSGALVNGAPVYSRLLVLGLLLLLATSLWGRLAVRRMQVVRQTRSLRASVGDVLEETFKVSNEGRLGCLWLEVLNETSVPGAAGSRLLTRVGGGQQRTYNARTWLTRRGSFPLGPTRLVSGDVFGFFGASRTFPARETLVVLPMQVDLDHFPLPPGLLPGGRPIGRKSMDLTPHASGIREYQPGDPLKRIHWPATARTGELMVKEFDQDPQGEVWIFLDAERGVHAEKPWQEPGEQQELTLFRRRPVFHLPPSTFEYAVTIAASLVSYAIREKRAAGLVSAGQVMTFIPAERSSRQEDKVLETLAFLEPEGHMSLGSLVLAQAGQLPRGSSVLLVTPSARRDVLLAVDDLQQRGLHPLVILLMAETFGGGEPGGPAMTALAERGVPVCAVREGDSLAQVLNQFDGKNSMQEGPRWPKPEYKP